MSLDDSYIEPYLQDWLAYIRKSSDAEQQVIKEAHEFRVPYAGVPLEAIKAIFIISDRFNVEHEAKYLAVHLLDRYLGCLYWERASSLPEVNAEAMQQLRQHMSSQLKLALASCLQIASKVDLFRTGLSISQVAQSLRSAELRRLCILLSECLLPARPSTRCRTCCSRSTPCATTLGRAWSPASCACCGASTSGYRCRCRSTSSSCSWPTASCPRAASCATRACSCSTSPTSATRTCSSSCTSWPAASATTRASPSAATSCGSRPTPASSGRPWSSAAPSSTS